MEIRFTILLVEVGLAMAAQVGVLTAVLLTVRKSRARIDSAVGEMQSRALPVLDSAQRLLDATRPKVEAVVDDVAASSALLRAQLQRMDATVTDIVDRARLQVIRADEMVSRTLDRVEETTELVQHSVLSPVRQFTGLIEGLSAALNVLRGRHRRGDGGRFKVPQDEMFI